MERGFGVVEKTTTKPYKGKTYYGFKLVGDDTLYRTGQINSNLENGVKVSFNYEVTDYGPMVDVKSVKAYQGKASAPTTGNKDDYWKNKELADVTRQKQISYQAATNTAVSMVNFAVDKGYIKIGAKASLEAYVASVVQLAGEIFNNYQTVPFGKEKQPAASAESNSEPEEEPEESPF
jgi:hypothetical protein